MPDSTTKCPKCGGGPMTQGCILDQMDTFETISQWAPGAPRGSGKLAPTTPQFKRLPILAFRCDTCGFLEFYARKLDAPK